MKFSRISMKDAKRIVIGRSYCNGCGAYGRLTDSDFASDTCSNCRPLCEGANEYPSSNMVHGDYATCYACGRSVKLDHEFGRMRKHTVGVKHRV